MIWISKRAERATNKMVCLVFLLLSTVAWAEPTLSLTADSPCFETVRIAGARYAERSLAPGCGVQLAVRAETATGAFAQVRVHLNDVLVFTSSTVGPTMEDSFWIAYPGARSGGRRLVARADALLTDGRRIATGTIRLSFSPAPERMGENGSGGYLLRDAGPLVLFTGSKMVLTFFLEDASQEDVTLSLRRVGESTWRAVKHTSSLVRITPESDRFEAGPVWSPFTVRRFRAEVDLEPDALYAYRIQRGSWIWPDVYLADQVVLRTPPSQPTDFHFGILADLRTYDGGSRQRQVEQQLARLAHHGMLDLVILPGDISNQKGTSFQYYQHFLRFYPITSFVPFYLIHGNHDLMRSSAEGRDGFHFFQLLELPKRASEDRTTYYSFDWGNTHFVALDMPSINGGFRRDHELSPDWQRYGPDSEQYQWLARDLKKAAQKRWRIVYAHGPLPDFVREDREGGLALIRLMLEHKVHLVIGGHWEYPHIATDYLDQLREQGEALPPGQLPYLSAPSGGSRNRDDEPESRTTPPIPKHCVIHTRNRHGLMVVRVSQDALLLTALAKDGYNHMELAVTQDGAGRPIGRKLWVDTAYCRDSTGRIRER